MSGLLMDQEIMSAYGGMKVGGRGGEKLEGH